MGYNPSPDSERLIRDRQQDFSGVRVVERKISEYYVSDR